MFPLHDKRRPCVQWKQYQTERASKEQVFRWWDEHPDAWIGVALGPISGILRVDVEGSGYAELVRLGGLPDTLSFKSPGGHGYLFQHCDGVTTKQVYAGADEHDELRVQAAGAYTCLPPSPGYSWLNDLQPSAIPRWMLDYYSAITLKDLERELRPTLRLPDSNEVLEALAFIPPDDYDKWVQVGMALHNSSEDLLSTWDTWSRRSTKYKEGECERKWRSFIDGGLTTRSILYWAEPYGYRTVNKHEPLTELGNARILARMGEGKILHSDKWGWLAWDGCRWSMEGGEKATVELQKRVLEYRLSRALSSLQRYVQANRDAEDFERRKKSKLAFVVAIRRHEAEQPIRGARVLAESEPALSCDYRRFNVNPWKLCCVNGTLDLRNGEMLRSDPSDMCTQLCPTAYIEDAECPRWTRFLEEVFAGDLKLVSWVQKLLGYCLTGIVKEHVLPILHGTGRNGKSTLIKAMQTVLGPDYSGTTSSGFLMASRAESHPTKLVALYGRRFIADLETGDGAKLNEELVKRITGDDEIQARRMHENFWSFKPTHKLFLCTNYEPRIRGMDIAIWSRIKMIPFTVSFAGREDRELDSTLAKEASGILRWMLQGCFRWQQEGLGESESVTKATDEYRGEQDTVGAFYAERIEVLVGSRVKRADVYSAYKGWCMGQGAEPASVKTFQASMLKLGVRADVTTKWYQDIKL